MHRFTRLSKPDTAKATRLRRVAIRFAHVPQVHAARTPDKPAIIAPATGETVTYRQLDENSTRVAHFLRDTWDW